MHSTGGGHPVMLGLLAIAMGFLGLYGAGMSSGWIAVRMTLAGVFGLVAGAGIVAYYARKRN